jgi:hypothetical protein
MLRGATNLTVTERFQPCIVGEDVTAKSYRQLLFLCYRQNHCGRDWTPGTLQGEPEVGNSLHRLRPQKVVWTQ